MLSQGTYPYSRSGQFQGYSWPKEEEKARKGHHVTLKETYSSMWSSLLDSSTVHGIKFLQR